MTSFSKLSPKAAYDQARAAGFVEDEAQARAVSALESLYQALEDGQGEARGLYLWGRVGRGKTWLMDSFYRSLSVPARRQHFHHFMRWVHRRQFQLTGTPEPLRQLAKELATEARVLCLDELFVNDIADAMLLGGVLIALFEQGVILVVTSNQAPEQLYADGFNRERFLPAVGALSEYLQVMALDGPQDHREHPGEPEPRYFIQNNGEADMLAGVFKRLARGRVIQREPIQLGHRSIAVLGVSDGVLWCRYDALCEAPLAATDFIDLCDRFDQVLLEGVPALDQGAGTGVIARGTEDAAQQVSAGDRQLPTLTRKDDGVRRFIGLVDECYDRGVPLTLSATVAMDELYRHGHLAFPFRRTLSRLGEMQLTRFGRG
ncbi:cell division protein ZapE [Halomonas halocynthiae]|uniref:cell division protein ZapE n=1 Tax=Halomonas halocynthiae TaxID=176290 RepID=UPI00041501EB|nr:cell division protein ZapE [Halomonas halocynthiae]